MEIVKCNKYIIKENFNPCKNDGILVYEIPFCKYLLYIE